MNTKPEVLVVEDEPSMQILLRHVLAKAGYTITVAPNGLEAKKILGGRTFDLICSDVMMSGIDGIQLCTWAHQQEGIRDIPFIILSSRAQHGERELGMEAGANAYLTKPFDIEELVKMFETLLPRKAETE
ncbi:MAG: Response regulator [Chlorobi bacterium]|nr:Response regulator [Chlorobiota bacterium]